ncbi:unnamed protein product [Cunninghamella blakesleeana]
MTLLKQTSIILFTIGAFVSAQSSGTPTSSAASSTSSSSSTSDGLLPQSSPTWLPNFTRPSNVNNGYTNTNQIDTNATLSRTTLNTTDYPEPWSPATTDHPEVQAVYNSIDWSKVPNATVHQVNKDGSVIVTGGADDYCWWSSSNCIQPKVNYLPQDVYYCPTAGDWGLNYDDGPYNPSDTDAVLNQYAEPQLYNFLAEHNNQKATLFYIGSNVVTYPAAAQRAINDGHVLCVHTWSHPAMTTQSNIQVVAELYWALRAIKEATGVTTKCWRPPYGDVDDRVRAIAWQMGMRTYLWDQDSNDWNMNGDGGGNLPWDTVMGYFEGWVDARKNGSDTQHGHITLEHELNNATVKMTEQWLPTLQTTFKVKSIHECMGITEPYWEQQWVIGGSNTTTTNTTTTNNNSTASSSGSNLSQASAGANITKNAGNVLTISKITGLVLSLSVIFTQL